MARQRRGGFRPPAISGDIKGTLGTLLRTTLAQAGVVREALERGVSEGRSRLDDALAGRRRTEALAELGELVLDLIRRGEIDLGELPEAKALVAQLDELDADHASDHEDPHEERLARPPTRSRSGARDARDPRGSRDDDGSVSSSNWRGAASSRTSATPRSPEPRVWRPSSPQTPTTERTTARLGKKLPKQGGISFEESDDDLEQYMHPDDVPPKGDPDRDA